MHSNRFCEDEGETAPSYFRTVWDLINTAHFSTICLIFLARRLMLAATVYTPTTPYKLVAVYVWQFNETCQDCSCRLPSNSPSFDHFEPDTVVYEGHKSQVLVLHLQCKVQAHIFCTRAILCNSVFAILQTKETKR